MAKISGEEGQAKLREFINSNLEGVEILAVDCSVIFMFLGTDEAGWAKTAPTSRRHMVIDFEVQEKQVEHD